MNSWRMYGWSLVALMLILIFMGCSVLPRVPAAPTLPPPPSDVRAEVPAGSSQSEVAAFYRKKASEYQADAAHAEDEAKRARTEARQAWLWWVGVASIILGAVAFTLAFAYPLAAFLRIGGWIGVGGGAASLLVGEALPYLGFGAIVTAIAIALSLIINSQALKAAIASWKSSAEAHGPVLRTGLDETSLKMQNRFVKPFLSKKLRK
jgi:hypothetical protein